MAAPSGFFEGLIRKRGLNVTNKRLAFYHDWARFENVPEWILNPLATTEIGRRSSVDIGYGPGKWNLANNGQGVGIFADLQAGIDATYTTLTNGRYDEILHAVDYERIRSRANLAGQIRTWGTTGFAALIEGGWDFPVVVAPPPVPTLEQKVEALLAALGGYEKVKAWNAKGNDLLLGYALEQRDQAQLAVKVQQLGEALQSGQLSDFLEDLAAFVAEQRDKLK